MFRDRGSRRLTFPTLNRPCTGLPAPLRAITSHACAKRIVTAIGVAPRAALLRLNWDDGRQRTHRHIGAPVSIQEVTCSTLRPHAYMYCSEETRGSVEASMPSSHD